MTKKLLSVASILLLTACADSQSATSAPRPRASDLGLKVGIVPAGPLDAITDVSGVAVGHSTIIDGDDIRTGITAVLPEESTPGVT